MSIQRNAVIAACLSLFAASAPAMAHDREGSYVFAGVGAASTEWRTKAAATPPGQKRGNTSSNTSYQLGAGYRFNNYFGVESTYADMAGQARREGIGGVDGKSLGVGAVGYLPIGDRFELFGKAGVGRTRYNFQSAAERSGPRTVRGTSSSPMLALGANFHLNRALSMRMEWSTLAISSKAFNEAIGAESLATTQWTAGLNYRF
ncbi:porin family protein [Stenotrophomonas rhizophila]|uniref:porin family protein n=1 Tax=Stenotrophomonas rhizophila TaxID=216778 RepID=UPI001E4072B0|nr:outer membrane beta-barrel protein [Stenotrophomonas rhizophila]MCC7634109.1 porin family protein [Stenotrophomonas rhizophila]MCC7662805.1 porin family protein [Stenotrophomonas rhizophila]